MTLEKFIRRKRFPLHFEHCFMVRGSKAQKLFFGTVQQLISVFPTESDFICGDELESLGTEYGIMTALHGIKSTMPFITAMKIC